MRVELLVSGRVQGVGFRAWTRAQALRLGLRGEARNLRDGRVAIVAEGPRTACQELLEAVRGPYSPGRVGGVAESWGEPEGAPPGFGVG